MRKHSLVADGRSCGESYDFLSSELPDSPNSLKWGKVCMILKDVVILIKDKNIMPRSFQIKVTYWSDGYIIVYKCKLLSSLLCKHLVWLNYDNLFSHSAEVLSDNSLDPSFSWASWRNSNNEISFLRSDNACNSCLILAVSVILNLRSNLFRSTKDLCERYWILDFFSHLFIERFNLFSFEALLFQIF